MDLISLDVSPINLRNQLSSKIIVQKQKVNSGTQCDAVSCSNDRNDVIIAKDSASQHLPSIEQQIFQQVTKGASPISNRELQKQKETSIEGQIDIQPEEFSRILSQIEQELQMNNENNFVQNEIDSYNRFLSSILDTSTPNQSFDNYQVDCTAPTPRKKYDRLESKGNKHSWLVRLNRTMESFGYRSEHEENLNNEYMKPSSILKSSSATDIQQPTFDPTKALLDPKTIPLRIVEKARQMLLSKSPILTRTCWNRRFGGDGLLCGSAVQLLVAADLLLEGKFAANGTKCYDGWIKNLPSDPTNATATLNFQQNKLNIFGVKWNEYVTSFRQVEFGHSKTSALVSNTGAEILRSKPYRDIGFILDESFVVTKDNKNSLSVVKQQNQVINSSDNSAESTIPMIINDSTTKVGKVVSSATEPSVPIANTSFIEIHLTSISPAPIGTSSNNSTAQPSTPKRPRRDVSPMKTRSKSRRVEK